MNVQKSPFAISLFTACVLSATMPINSSAASLMYSGSANRSSPVLLGGQSLSGNVYIWATQDVNTNQVQFYLDDPAMSRTPIKTEGAPPYDFAGTAPDNTAYPYNTASLTAGSHTLTAKVTYSDGSAKVFSASFNCPSAVNLLLSSSASRTGPVPLSGASVPAKMYVWATQDTNVSKVLFYLDDSSMSRTPIKTEAAAPYDFAGTAADGTAYPYDTSTLSTGNHSLTARVVYTNGTYKVVNATFNRPVVATPAPLPTATPTPTPTPKPTATPMPTFGKKWHPGHYLNGYWGTNIPMSISRVKDNPNLKGISVVHAWRDLESSKGVYNFSAIESELSQAKAANKRLMIQIADRTFHANRPDCVPDYVKADPLYKGGQTILTRADGSFMKCTALRWIPEVQDRLIALYTALGKRFNAEPNFEAIFLEEDGVERTGTNMSQYSDRLYTDQQKRGMTGLANAFPNTIVFKFLNWGPNVGELFAHAYQVGLGVGGPDLIPNEKTFATPYYGQYAGRMPLEISVQDPRVIRYINEGGTVEKMFDFGITDPNGLHVNYIVWDQPYTTVLDYTRDILPVINAHKGYINSGCPLNIDCQ